MKLSISYGFSESPFGCCFIAFTNDAICALHFPDSELDKMQLLAELMETWADADIEEDEERAKLHVDTLFTTGDIGLGVMLRGTDFQSKVWAALVNIPFGTVVSYSHVASMIDNANAVRAVATAIANNPVCYLIPCHRVIRKSGEIGQYRWTTERKKKLIAWEKEKALDKIES